MYNNVYVVNVIIQSISGRHSITEEDLGLTPGTLPPEDLATLGSLIVVDKKLLAPFERLRARAKRLLAATGVRVGAGTVVVPADYPKLKQQLDDLSDEFYLAKQDLIASFDQSVQDRSSEHPEYAALIQRYAPKVGYVDKRLSFDVDTYKFDIPQNDPHHSNLEHTLRREGNDIRKRLVGEIANFVNEVCVASIDKDGRLVKANLGPLRKVLLPKIESFQLLDSALSAVARHLHSFITDTTRAIEAKPTGEVFLSGSELDPYKSRLLALRTTAGIESLVDYVSSPSQNFGVADTPQAQPVQQRDLLPPRPKGMASADRSQPVMF